MDECLKLPYLGMKINHWQKFQKLHTCTFLPQGAKWSLFSFRRQPFSRYGWIFQNFHIWAWNLEFEEGPTVAYVLSFYYRWSKLSLFSLYWQPFSGYGPIVTCFPTWVKTRIWRKFPKLQTHPLSTPRVEIKLIFALRANVLEIE